MNANELMIGDWVLANGNPRESVCRCCNGKQKTAGGYKWKYIDKEIVL